MIQGYCPEVNLNQGGIGKTSQIAAAGFFKISAFRFADYAGELDTPDAPDALRLKGYCTGDIVISPELGAMLCNRIGGYYKCVVVFIPGIKT